AHLGADAAFGAGIGILRIWIQRGPRREIVEALEAVECLEQPGLWRIDHDRALDMDVARQRIADGHQQNDDCSDADQDALQDLHGCSVRLRTNSYSATAAPFDTLR